MAIGKVEICGVDTSTLPVISNERMRQLFPLVHSGDLQAREEFIRGNLRLVLSVLQRFHHRGENVDDLFQVGCIGLIKALDHFDVTQNVRFSTYAVPMIIGEIRRYLRDNNAIRVSRSLRDALTIGDQVRDDNVNAENWLQNIAIREAMNRLSEREQRILSLRFFQGRTQMEVAGEIGISQAQVSRLEKAALSHMRKLV